MTFRDALRAARSAGLSVRISDLGTWPGRPVLAEYDPSVRTIAINARVVAAFQGKHGSAFARRFVAFAIRHELHHHVAGSRDEAAANASAERHCGEGAISFEAAARALGFQ